MGKELGALIVESLNSDRELRLFKLVLKLLVGPMSLCIAALPHVVELLEERA